MERDFIGVISGRNSRVCVMEESHGGHFDSAFSVSSAVHWPFQNKASTLQKFMPFEAPEKLLGMERHGVAQFPIQASTRRFEDANFTAMSQSSIPIAMANPLLKSHGASIWPNPTATTAKQPPFGSIIASNPSFVTNMVGSSTPRNASKPKPPMKNAQLTIFYAGSVNVYDDVDSHMAETIMLMASKECEADISARNLRSEASVMASLSKGMVFQTLNNSANHVQDSCSRIKTASEHLLAGDKKGAKSIGELIFAGENESTKTINSCMGAATSATIMPRAVPQARRASLARFLEKRKERASLARFLEKRKERVSNMIPYSCEKKSSDSSIVLEGAPLSSKCSSTGASISSNRCGSWYVSQRKSSNDIDEFPSTKLEI